jgi:hypothetical protein
MLWAYPTDFENPEDQTTIDAITLASQILYSLSGRKYGGIKGVTEIYTCEHKFSECGDRLLSHAITAIGGFNIVRLRGNPVLQVQQVVLNGELLNSEDYEIVNSNELLLGQKYLSGCYTLTVTYAYGVEPPEAARIATKILAQELLLAVAGDNKCRLPSRIRSVTRQNLTYDFNVDTEFIKEKKTGITEVDLWLTAVNPSKSSKRAKVFRPDAPKVYKRTV